MANRKKNATIWRKFGDFMPPVVGVIKKALRIHGKGNGGWPIRRFNLQWCFALESKHLKQVKG
jgi:hypothetical protein